MLLAGICTLLRHLLLEEHHSFDDGPIPLQDRAQASSKLVLGLLSEDLLIHLENLDAGVLISYLHRLGMLPVVASCVCIPSLRPFFVLAGFITLLCEVLLELSLVGGPLGFEAGSCLFYVALNCFSFYFCYRSSLHEEGFFVSDCLR